MANKTFRQEYESIGAFLVLELLALVGFGLGGVNVIFQYAGFVIALIATYFAFKNFSKEDIKPILFVAVPLFLMSIFTSFSHYYDCFTSFNILAKIGSFLAITSFLAMGLAARRMQSLSFKKVLYCLGGGLALITLVSTIITWSQYGLFYPLIHAKAGSYYYDGNLYSILDEMSWLNGFKIMEVSQKYGGTFALLSACFLPALLFVKPKEDKVGFILFATIGGIGLISIISIPNFYALIIFAIAFAAALFYRFLRDNAIAVKIVSYGILGIAGVAVVLIVFAMLNATVPAVHNTIAGSGFLDRIFNSNRIMVVGSKIFEAALKPFNLFGINTIEYHEGFVFSKKDILTSSGCFEIEVLREGGIFGFLFFLLFVFFAYESFARYLKSSKDDHFVKVVLLTFVVAFVLYSTICYEIFPLTHEETAYYPFTQSLPFYLVLFVIGFTILPKGKEAVEYKNEAVPVKKEKKSSIDDDYTFSDVTEEEII